MNATKRVRRAAGNVLRQRTPMGFELSEAELLSAAFGMTILDAEYYAASRTPDDLATDLAIARKQLADDPTNLL
jgi:hypothetical protein